MSHTGPLLPGCRQMYLHARFQVCSTSSKTDSSTNSLKVWVTAVNSLGNNQLLHRETLGPQVPAQPSSAWPRVWERTANPPGEGGWEQQSPEAWGLTPRKAALLSCRKWIIISMHRQQALNGLCAKEPNSFGSQEREHTGLNREKKYPFGLNL